MIYSKIFSKYVADFFFLFYPRVKKKNQNPDFFPYLF